MAFYRKRPDVVEAWQVQSNMGSCPEWITDEIGKSVRGSGGMPFWFVLTAEGEKRAALGDWIIKESDGGLAVIGNEIFAAIYRPIAR